MPSSREGWTWGCYKRYYCTQWHLWGWRCLDLDWIWTAAVEWRYSAVIIRNKTILEPEGLGYNKCVTSVKENVPLSFTFCKDLAEDQNVEIGTYEENNGTAVLRPLGERIILILSVRGKGGGVLRTPAPQCFAHSLKRTGIRSPKFLTFSLYILATF